MPEHPSAIGGAFRRPFKEQVAFFRQKMGKLVPTRRWDDLTGAAHDQAFMVAGAQKADLLADLAASIDRAIADGTSLEMFRRDFRAAVDSHDWHGWTGEDTKGGRAWRTRTIYRTNTYTAYAAGRFAQLKAAGWKYWVYLHGGSMDPRPEHLHVFNGLVLPPEHPFWTKHYPPSDWGCSCYVVGANTLAQARRLGGDPDKKLPDGWDAIDPATGEPAGIGKGWGYAPGASVWAAVAAKVASWPPEVAADFIAALPQQLRLNLDLPEIAEPPITSVKQLNDEEREAFYEYTGSGYGWMNESLRFGDEPGPEVLAMDRVFRRARLSERMVLYRGVDSDYARELRDRDLQPDDMIEELGFMSTSVSPKVARDWADKDDEGLGIFIKLDVPAGIGGIDLVAISLVKREREVLLERGLVMRVVRWDAEAGELEVVIDGKG